MIYFDIKTARGGDLVSTIMVGEQEAEFLKSVYNRQYLKNLEKSFGAVKLERRVEEDVMIIKKKV